MLKVTTQSSIGIDGGGDFFKICMYIMVKDEEEITSKKMKYSGGAFSKDSKSGSVKKLIILAICQDIPENYENLVYSGYYGFGPDKFYQRPRHEACIDYVWALRSISNIPLCMVSPEQTQFSRH